MVRNAIVAGQNYFIAVYYLRIDINGNLDYITKISFKRKIGILIIILLVLCI